MAAVDTAHRESSTIALSGLGRALILAGKLGQKSAEDIHRKAESSRPRFIAEVITARRLCPNCKAPAGIPGTTRIEAGYKEDEPGLTSLEEVLAVSNE